MAWPLLVVTLLLYGLIAPAHAQAPPKPAAPRSFIENSSSKALAPTLEAFKQAVKAAGWSVLKITNMARTHLGSGEVVPSSMNCITLTGMIGGQAGTVVVRKSGAEMGQVVAETARKLGK